MTGTDAGSGSGSDGRWARWIDAEATAIRTAGQWREPRSFDAAGPAGRLTATGQDVVSFASNSTPNASWPELTFATAVPSIFNA